MAYEQQQPTIPDQTEHAPSTVEKSSDTVANRIEKARTKTKSPHRESPEQVVLLA